MAFVVGLVGILGVPAQGSNAVYGCWQSLCDEICGGPNSGICVYNACVCP
ncbi:MAG TPA: hypothetical protein VK899_00135 [Gemmatimonadales bacterium]|nr:hypothetical protein [Gemmatimonadales bacterium]